MSDSEHSTVTYTSVSEDDSDIGSPGVDGPPIMPKDPYAYIMAAYEVPPSRLILWPEEDEILPEKEQPLPAAASPTADSPGYVPESDPEEEPEEHNEDPEEDPADYPADRDDDDDEDEDEDEDEEEEEEHPAPDGHTSPPLPYHPPHTQIAPTHIEIPESCLPLRKRVRFASPTPSREVGESSAAGAARQDRPTIARDDPYSIAREDLYGFVDMVDVPPRCSTSRELDYDITDTWDDLVGAIDEIAPTTVEGVNQRVTDLATIVEEETTSMYGIMEDAQDDRSQLRGRVNLLYRDRPVHRRLAVMIEREAKMAREAWGLSRLVASGIFAQFRCYVIHTTSSGQRHYFRVKLAGTTDTDGRILRRANMTVEGLSQPDAPGRGLLADCIDLLFCLATQYRSFVQDILLPKGEIKKLELECGNLKVQGVDGTPKPKTNRMPLSSPLELMDKKINTWAERQADSKRKFDDTTRNNQNQQPNKRQNTGRAYTA
ncbi:hypothetical protein Tco_0564977 [Tanacetum coccineum]